MSDLPQPTIDDTPISPSRPDAKRKNSLEKHLAQRPDKAELIQSKFHSIVVHKEAESLTSFLPHPENILLDSTVAPALQAQQRELEKHMRADSLNEKIAQRPSPEELKQKNILPSSTAAPAIVAQQQELAKHMRADSLNEKIAHRPSPEELIREGVLREDPRSPDERYAEAIEDEYAKREGGA